jgi:hypothetical protein
MLSVDTPFATGLREMQQAVRDEIDAARRNGGQRYALTNGALLSLPELVYRFDTEAELRVADDSPIELERAGQPAIKGQIICSRRFSVVVALSEHLGLDVARAQMVTHPEFILEKLLDGLLQLTSSPNARTGLLQRLLSPSMGNPKPPDARRASLGLNLEQHKAVSACLKNRAWFVWGPPGTGKTRTLAEAAMRVIEEKGESLLLVAHSNAAVDVAVRAVLDAAAGVGYAPGHAFLRYGPPVDRDDRTLGPLTAGQLAKSVRPRLHANLTDLEKEEADVLERLSDVQMRTAEARSIYDKIELVRAKLRPLREEMKQLEAELVSEARLVACTLSKAAIEYDLLARRRFDAVFVDEASMALVPGLMLAASLADRRVCVFGDFRQLAPIVQAETECAKRWMIRDIFGAAGIADAIAAGRRPARLTMLRTQYRMHSSIMDLVGHLAYQGRLRSAAGVDDHVRQYASCEPAPSRNVAVIYTDRIEPACYKESGEDRWSHFSPFSAAIVAESVVRALGSFPQSADAPIAVISPYAAQARLIRSILIDMGTEARATVSTVHRLQGAEAPIVIFDAVDSRPLDYPGILLRDSENDATLRLLNVAISRAQGKFIFVGDTEFLERGAPAVRRLLNYLIAHHSPFYHADKCCGEADVVRWFFDEPDTVGPLGSDVHTAASSIRLWGDPRRLATPIAAQLATHGGARLETAFNGYPAYRSEMPLLIDGHIVWFLPTEREDGWYRPALRFCGTRTASALISLMGLHDK